jgi:hypothetical protein
MVRMLPILPQLFLELCQFFLIFLDLSLMLTVDLLGILDGCFFGHECHIPIKDGLLEDVYFFSKLLLNGLVLSSVSLTLPERLHAQ